VRAKRNIKIEGWAKRGKKGTVERGGVHCRNVMAHAGGSVAVKVPKGGE